MALQADLDAQDAAVEEAEAVVKRAKEDHRQAVEELRVAQAAIRDKDDMLRFVEGEVDRVKTLFEEKGRRLRAEKDAAERDAEAARRAMTSSEAQLRASEETITRLRDDVARLQASGTTWQRRAEQAEGDTTVARRKVQETEHEMRDLLVQLEKERENASRRMRQLGAVLGELQSGLMGGPVDGGGAANAGAGAGAGTNAVPV